MENPTAYPVLALAAELGEGPTWDERQQRLYLVDISGKRAHWFEPGSGRHGSFATPAVIGALALRQDGGLLLACHDHFVLAGPDGSGQVVLEVPEVDGDMVRFNDGKVDPWGRFVVGTMHWHESDPEGALYILSPDRALEVVLTSVTISNGLAWSADGRVMYFIDTPTRRVDAFDVNPANGALSGRREVVKITDGHPDGMTIDAEGCLWVAIWDGGRVDRYSPNGERLLSVRVPGGGRVSSAAFGGTELRTLYITTARKGLTNAELQEANRAGDLFAFDTDVDGLPSYRFGAPAPA